jgi:deoxyhypusine synthase
MEKVNPINIEKDMKVSDLVREMKGAGFGARKIGRAKEIVGKMFSDSECKVYFGMAGAMVPAGMKQIVIDLIREKKIDVLVTTGANLTHDLIEALGDEHYHCDKWDDEEFAEKGYDRMYNVLMKNEVYVKIEKFLEDNWERLKDAKDIRGFLKLIGEILSLEKGNKYSWGREGEGNKYVTTTPGRGVMNSEMSEENSETSGGRDVGGDSILRACFEMDVSIYCPALADSGIGLIIWGRKVQGREISIDAFDDMKDIIDFAWQCKKSGVIYVGGGTPKNFIQQSLQFSKGAEYGVQITTDRAESGGSSGAPLEEGKSWGKLKKGTKEGENYVDVMCDATIALPLIFSK